MLPLLPFAAGIAVGVYAAKALQRGDVRENLQKTAKTLFDVAQATMQDLQQRSGQWRAQCERWGQQAAYAPDMDDEDEQGAADSELDDDEPQPRRRNTRRGGRRRTRREEPDSSFDTEDDAPASEAANEGSASERA